MSLRVETMTSSVMMAVTTGRKLKITLPFPATMIWPPTTIAGAGAAPRATVPPNETTAA